MKVLGIDPGTARVGWGIVEKKKGNVTLVEYGCITTSQKEKPEMRLLTLFKEIKKILVDYTPDSAAIEDLFYTTNAKTVISVAQARGVLLLALAEEDILITSYSPLAIKRAVSGYGRAEKLQMQKMVKTILHLSEIPKPDDAADAIAVALTHSFTTKFI